MNFNDRLEKLLKEHNLDTKSIKKEKLKLIKDKLHEIANKFEHLNNRQPEIIIWGASDHTLELMSLTSKLSVKYIVDNNEKLLGSKINDKEILSPKYLKEIKFDIFLISSYSHRNDIKDEIKKTFPEKQYIDIYEFKFLKESRAPFYFCDSYDYFDLKVLIKNYEKDKSEKNLKNLIRGWLCIRDFVSTKIYIEEYLQLKFKDSEKMISFKKQLNELLKDFKNSLLMKENENIIFMIIDALSDKDVRRYMPYLQDFRKSNINIKNSYCPSTFTTGSHKAMFSGKRLFEKETLEVETIKSENSPLLNELEKKHYEFYNLDSLLIWDRDFFNFIGNSQPIPLAQSSKTMTKTLWEYFSNSLEFENKKNFSYIRLLESHAPNISGYTDLLNKSTYNIKIKPSTVQYNNNDYIKALIYIDIQLKFYFEYINEETLIITSDHGNGSYKDTFKGEWKLPLEVKGDDRIKVPLVIKKNGYRNIEVDSIFSTQYISEIILNLLNQNKLYIDKREYVIIERAPIYNEEARKKFIAQGLEKYIKAFRIIRTNDEKYIVYQDGTEEYYLIHDECNNLIHDLKYYDRIKYFRNLEENEDFPWFCYSQNLL